jgi:hypothetical protein
MLALVSGLFHGGAVAQELVDDLQDSIPLVYEAEHTGSGFPLPRFPALDELPAIVPLTDPFAWSDGNGRSTHSFEGVDASRCFAWLGSGNPEFPGASNAYTMTLEAECAAVGGNWVMGNDSQTSGGKFLTPKPGLQSPQTAPDGSENHVIIPFNLDRDGPFTVFARLNCPSADDDSCWYKIDDGEFITRNGLGTSGWQWITMEKHALESGPHTLTLAFREDGFQLDKLSVSTFFLPPVGMGDRALNSCDP